MRIVDSIKINRQSKKANTDRRRIYLEIETGLHNLTISFYGYSRICHPISLTVNAENGYIYVIHYNIDLPETSKWWTARIGKY